MCQPEVHLLARAESGAGVGRAGCQERELVGHDPLGEGLSHALVLDDPIDESAEQLIGVEGRASARTGAALLM
ncbi:hypothetical protein [Streptomyces sp. NPDC056663]|uniref:hypothetical protein n=1 Tax=Streptomyces sp. NPDC056663 TaxID=3345899 RepID=UPI0036B19491